MIVTSQKYRRVKNIASQLKIKELSKKFKISTATVCKIKKSTDYSDYKNINKKYAENVMKNVIGKSNTHKWYSPVLNFFQT
jgi:DNA-binding MurR/RpiR family transcriptional regulator